MLPSLVIFVTVYFFRSIYAVIENRCCCGCPLTPCPVELKAECPDPTLSCSIYQPNSTFPMVDCRVLLGASTNPDKEYEFVPIGKDSFKKEFTTTKTIINMPTMTPSQDVGGGGSPMMAPTPLFSPLIQPTITGTQNNIPRALRPPGPPLPQTPPYGLGYELGNMLGKIIDSVRDLVGVTLANAIPQPMPLLTNR
ncbi:unnamed protein product [Cylicocyclus nassatus]|uniref:Uncharacterized protein n=1 Tax=Cylicocyclus nassatus TaxID=53992 RepID=A0AA36DK62_CYLNA|nr:unnamed protein product [Cylicocyclus nassatus]